MAQCGFAMGGAAAILCAADDWKMADGFHADLNETYLIGKCDEESIHLVTSAALSWRASPLSHLLTPQNKKHDDNYKYARMQR